METLRSFSLQTLANQSDYLNKNHKPHSEGVLLLKKGKWTCTSTLTRNANIIFYTTKVTELLYVTLGAFGALPTFTVTYGQLYHC